MTRAMLLAAALFDPHRTPAAMRRSPAGDLDEAAHVTPGQLAWLELLLPRQRAFYLGPAKHRASTRRGRP